MPAGGSSLRDAEYTFNPGNTLTGYGVKGGEKLGYWGRGIVYQ